MSKSIDIKELPKSWERAKLSDCCLIIMGQSPPGSTYNTEGKGLPFFQGKAEFGEMYPTVQKWCTAPTKIAEKDDVLISIRAPVGPTNLCQYKACIGRGLAAIRPVGGIPSKYILYSIREAVEELVKQGTGTTFDAINGKILNSHTINLAPLKEQIRIVEEIEKQFTRIDTGVEELKAIQDKLSRYRTAVLKAAFEGKLVQQNPNEEAIPKYWISDEKEQKGIELFNKNLSALIRGRKMKQKADDTIDAELGLRVLPELPKKWQWIPLSLIAQSMQNGIYKPANFYSDDGVPCLRMYNIEEGRIVWKDIKRMILSEEEVEKYLLKPGDLLVNRVNSRELVGKTAIITRDIEPCVYESKNIRLRIKKDFISSDYLNYWFLYFAHTYFEKNAQQTVGMASINQTQLGAMPIPLPPRKEQNRIAKEITRQFAYASELLSIIAKQINQSAHLKQDILKHAFEGTLIPQDPNDEPAKVLIERIRKLPKEIFVKVVLEKIHVKVEIMEKRKLYDVLKAAKKKMTPKDLFEKSGHSEESIDDFYRELKEEIGKRIFELRPNYEDVYLEVRE